MYGVHQHPTRIALIAGRECGVAVNCTLLRAMGLDSYLYKRTYVGWTGARVTSTDNTNNAKDTAHIRPDRVEFVIERVATWHKFNALHRWFMDHCRQKGREDNDEHDVTYKQLSDLLTTLKQLLATPDRAADLFPTQRGMFFGSAVVYDTTYYDQVASAVLLLESILSETNAESCAYKYVGSW